MLQRLIIICALILSASTVTADDRQTSIQKLHILIPGAAGGGWDRTARGTGEALSRSGLVDRVTFENMSGGGGSKAHSQSAPILATAAAPETADLASCPLRSSAPGAAAAGTAIALHAAVADEEVIRGDR